MSLSPSRNEMNPDQVHHNDQMDGPLWLREVRTSLHMAEACTFVSPLQNPLNQEEVRYGVFLWSRVRKPIDDSGWSNTDQDNPPEVTRENFLGLACPETFVCIGKFEDLELANKARDRLCGILDTMMRFFHNLYVASLADISNVLETQHISSSTFHYVYDMRRIGYLCRRCWKKPAYVAYTPETIQKVLMDPKSYWCEACKKANLHTI